MSIEAVHWSLDVPVGGNAKVILIGIANHASPDGSGAYPSLETLSGYAHCDRSTARRNLRRLEEDGWLIRTGTGPRGQACYRVPIERPASGITPPPGGLQNASGNLPRVANGVAFGVAPVPPEPITETMGDTSPIPPPTAEELIFETWLASTGKTARTLLDGKRRRIIRRAQKLYPIEDLLDAVDGWRFSPHHRGENDTATVYNGLELLLRDAEHIEKFRDLKRNGNVVPLRPATKQSAGDMLHRIWADQPEAS